MDGNFVSPTSPFTKSTSAVNKSHIRLPHFSTPAGMLLPKDKQPPPMYGPRGSTIPPQYMKSDANHSRFNDGRGKSHQNFRGGRGRGRGGRQGGGGRQHNHTGYDRENNVQNYEVQSKSEGTWCETCDRGFRNHDQLAEHKAQHQTCGIEGCSFTGHPAVVKKHVEMQHQNGLFEQIKKLESPEEIAKWREERRKRYPTKSNMELRQQMQEDKMKRGEKLSDPNNRFGRKRDRRQMKSEPHTRFEQRPGKKKRNKRQKVEKVTTETRIEPEKKVVEEPMMVEDTNLFRFLGTRSMKNSWHSKGEPEQTQKNALASLLDCYGSDSESDASQEQQAPPPEPLLLKVRVETTSKVESELEEGEISDSTDIPDPSLEIAIAECPVEAAPDSRKRQRNRPKKTVQEEQAIKKPKIPQRAPRRTNTLLEKLLQPEIRHERNVLLQCVRYVVEQKMFGIGAENKETVCEPPLSTRPVIDSEGKE